MHQEKAVRIVFSLFGVAVLFISATTSFSFFYNFFSGIVPPELVGQSIASLIAGTVGVLLLDGACVVWLATYLHHSDTSDQRAIAMTMTIITFVGAAGASVAHLGLSASDDLAFVGDTADFVGIAALIVVVLAVVANFGAAQYFSYQSPESQLRNRENDRRDRIADAEAKHEKALDKLVAGKVEAKLDGLADGLAETQATALTARFYGKENGKYTTAESLPQSVAQILPQAEVLPHFAAKSPVLTDVQLQDVKRKTDNGANVAAIVESAERFGIPGAELLAALDDDTRQQAEVALGQSGVNFPQ